MKKDVISIFDGETERTATPEEKIGISIVFLIVLPFVLLGLFLLLSLFLIVCGYK